MIFFRKLEDFRKDDKGDIPVNSNIAQVRFDHFREKRRFKLI